MALLSFLLVLITGIVLVTGMVFPFQCGKTYRGYRCRQPHETNVITFQDDNTFYFKKNQSQPLTGTWQWDQDLGLLTLVYNYNGIHSTQIWTVFEELDEDGKIQVKRLTGPSLSSGYVLSSNINGFKLIDDSRVASSSNQPAQGNISTDIDFDDNLHVVLDSFQYHNPDAAKWF